MRRKVEPAELTFAPPENGGARSFSCDNDPINGWFAGQSQSEHELFNCRVKHALLDGEKDIVGFYAIRVRLEPKSDFGDSAWFSRLRWENKVTTVHLQWFAVRSGFERRGIGTYMLGQVIEDAYDVINIVGAHALTLRYIGNASESLYKGSGFVEYGGSGSKQLFMPAQKVIEFIESD